MVSLLAKLPGPYQQSYNSVGSSHPEVYIYQCIRLLIVFVTSLNLDIDYMFQADVGMGRYVVLLRCRGSVVFRRSP